MYMHNASIDKSKEDEKMLFFINKIKTFEQIQTIEEAKQVAKDLFHIQNEISYIKAGDAYCTIINRKNLLRIVIKNQKEK